MWVIAGTCMRVCMCVYACMCARARARACVCVLYALCKWSCLYVRKFSIHCSVTASPPLHTLRYARNNFIHDNLHFFED